MPIDLIPHLEPAKTAVVALEVQANLLVPGQAMIPGIAAHAASIGLVERLAGLYQSARRVGARVLYVTDGRRRDGLGAAKNMLTARAITAPRVHPGHGPIVALLAPHPSDIVIERAHGMTGFHTTPLDQYLRNLGITSIVITGVSANIAVNGTAIEAMNRGYRVIVPSDGIAGDPPEYVEMLLRYTIRNVALVAPTRQIVEYWDALPGTSPDSPPASSPASCPDPRPGSLPRVD